MANAEHVYHYSQPSSLNLQGTKPSLQLAADSGPHAHGTYFTGKLFAPRITARNLRQLATVVGSRFYVHPSMLARILAEADPVVTVGRDVLRFEGFSACCSTYARLDIEQDGFDAEHAEPGTTNVDFGPEMRAALAKVREDTPLSLTVGASGVALASKHDVVTEKKVPLPHRWIKGFCEVQSHLASMTKRHTLSRVQAQRFLRGLPRSAMHQPQWLVRTGGGFRLASRASNSGICIRGAERLRLLETLVDKAKCLIVYASDENESSGWALDFGSQRFTLVVSPHTWRGFSGEGQLLLELAADPSPILASVRAQLNWQSELNAGTLADDLNATLGEVERALVALAAVGILGYDINRDAYFHRALPFDLSEVESHHPRLLGARKLIESGAVRRTDYGVEVKGSDVLHQVRLSDEADVCTCPWYAKHRDERGPCKHVLAARMLMDRGT